jgi:anti-sigma B factor antagonist
VTSEEQFFSVEVEQLDSRATVVVKGEVDVATAPELLEAVESVTDATQELVLDVAELGFMDSTGLRVLIRAHEMMEGRGGRLSLRSVDATTRKLLEITGVDKVIHIE